MLIIAAFIVITSANAQSLDKVSMAISWSYKNGEWVVLEKNYPETMYVMIIENTITISNKSNSRYITYGDFRKEEKKDYESHTWDAYDEDSRKCTFTVTNYFDTPGYSIFIIYKEDLAVQYTIAGK